MTSPIETGEPASYNRTAIFKEEIVPALTTLLARMREIGIPYHILIPHAYSAETDDFKAATLRHLPSEVCPSSIHAIARAAALALGEVESADAVDALLRAGLGRLQDQIIEQRKRDSGDEQQREQAEGN